MNVNSKPCIILYEYSKFSLKKRQRDSRNHKTWPAFGSLIRISFEESIGINQKSKIEKNKFYDVCILNFIQQSKYIKYI